jgi:hypothetical protein
MRCFLGSSVLVCCSLRNLPQVGCPDAATSRCKSVRFGFCVTGGFGDRLRVIPWEANFLFELELLSWKLGDEKVIKKVCEAGIWIISEM